MDERNVNLQKLVPKLITSLTGFKPNQENFKIILEFSYSQFKYHKFLSVNSHAVTRDIDGICQKFKLNHFHDEEKIIRKFFEQALSHEMPANQKEVMYSVISMLINLAYDPINKLKERKRKGLPIFIKPSQNTEQDENLVSRKNFIDSLLKENFVVPKNDCDESDLSEWTESEDDEAQKTSEHSDEEEEPSIMENHLKSSKFRPPRKPEVYKTIRLESSLEWLKENTQNDWWNVDEVTSSEVLSSHRSANFFVEWQKHLIKKSLGFSKAPPTSLLSEYCLLREILWMFLNPVDCKFFKIQDGEITLRKNVCIHSTTVGSLKIFLKNFIKPMNIMYTLRNDVLKSLKDSSLNHTLESYYGLLQKFLDGIMDFLILEEETLKERKEIFTILTLNEKMQCHFKMLDMLNDIHVSCISNDSCQSHIRSLYLIASLNYLVINSACKELKNLALTFLLTCLRTYFQILDIWWTEARINDTKNEFLVEKIVVEEIEFVQPRLVAKCKEKSFYVNDKISQRIVGDSLVSSLMYYSVEASFTLEIINKLDRIHEMKKIGDSSHSLYDEFMESILEEIKKLSSNTRIEVVHQESDPVKEMTNNQKIAANIRNEMLAENDDIMCLIFNDSFESLGFTEEPTVEEQSMKSETNPIRIYEMLNEATDFILMPLENSIERFLKLLLAKKIAIAEKFVMDIYFKELHIDQYIRDVRKVYFLESNELMNLFNLSLFQQMESGDKWANSYLLTVLFNESVTTVDSTLFTVHVNKILRHQTVLEAIDELTIYLNVNNNFDNIFCPDSISKYNEIFRFLLKIKWAQRILNCLLFPDFYKHRPPYAKFTMLDLVIKRIALVRFSMQQAITMIHNHLMVSLQSLCVQFEENIAKTRKITDLIMYHTAFVESFHVKALLGDGSKRVRGIVIEMIKLAKVVANEWSNITTFYELDSAGKTVDDSISLTTLNVNTIEIEKAFKVCENQLKDLFDY